MTYPKEKRVSILVYPEVRERLRAIATRENQSMKVVLERAICNEMKRTGTPDTGKHSEAA